MFVEAKSHFFFAILQQIMRYRNYTHCDIANKELRYRNLSIMISQLENPFHHFIFPCFDFSLFSLAVTVSPDDFTLLPRHPICKYVKLPASVRCWWSSVVFITSIDEGFWPLLFHNLGRTQVWCYCITHGRTWWSFFSPSFSEIPVFSSLYLFVSLFISLCWFRKP